MLTDKQDDPARTHCCVFFRRQGGFRMISRPSFSRMSLAADRTHVHCWFYPLDRDARGISSSGRNENVGARQEGLADLLPGTIGEKEGEAVLYHSDLIRILI